MDLAPQSGIIVDSSFSSRKELVRDLNASKLVEEIYEAKSIADAIKRLIDKQTDLCFIGPTVSTPVVVNFAKSVQAIPSKIPCALIAVIGKDQPQDPELQAAGISGVLQKPYSKETFTSITLRAIRQARAEMKGTPKTAADLLTSLAAELFKHSEAARYNMSAGSNMRFQQKLYGDIRNAINKILAQAIDANPENDSLFARTITEWFFEAARSGRITATENLRMKLITNTLD